MNIFCFKKPILLFVIIILLYTLPVIAGSGGGPGTAVTPYHLDQPISLADVALIKKKSREIREPISTELSMDAYQCGLGLMYWKKDEDFETIEKIDYFPNGIKLPDHFSPNIRFDLSKNQVILKGLLSIDQLRNLNNALLSQYDSSVHEINSFDPLSNALDNLYLRPRFKEGVLFEFRGVTESGKQKKVDFSEIWGFKLIKIEQHKSRALFLINIFPDISIEKLLKSNMSYSQLEKEHSKSITLWIDLKDKNNRDLCFVSVLNREYSLSHEPYSKIQMPWFDGNKYFVNDTQPIKNLPENTTVGFFSFNAKTLWWAVPSVVKDEQYPIRDVLSK